MTDLTRRDNRLFSSCRIEKYSAAEKGGSGVKLTLGPEEIKESGRNQKAQLVEK